MLVIKTLMEDSVKIKAKTHSDCPNTYMYIYLQCLELYLYTHKSVIS